MFAFGRRSAIASILILTTSLTAQPSPFTAGATIDVSIVNVDVVVTDREGNRVRGLTRDDFEIQENGRRQQITNFAEYASGDARVGVEGSTRSEDAAPRQPRNLLIFFERMRLPNFSAEPLVEELRNFVKRTIGPGDSVGIVIWSRHEGTKHVDFTDDLQMIDGTLATVAKELQRAQLDPTSYLREEGARVRQFERDAGTNTGPSTTSLTLAMLMAYGDMKVRVNAINSAINTMAGAEGKKIMLLATQRIGEVAGAEFAYAAGLNPLPYELRHRFGTETLVRSIIDTANASGVTIYPLHPLGLGSSTADATSNLRADEASDYLTLQNETVSQNLIAQRTGGLAATSTKDVVRLLPRIASDVSDYYSLAYRVTPTGKDVARDIVVKTRNPELRVRARRQFIEKSDETRMRDRLRAAFFRAGDESQIDIQATIGVKKRRGTSTVPLRVRIPIADLTVLPQGGGKHAGSFSVYVGSVADLDELSDVTRKTQPFELKEADLAKARAGHFTYDLDVTVNAKARYVAVAVLDDVGRTYGLRRLTLEQAH